MPGICLCIVDIKKNGASKLSLCFAIAALVIKSLPFISERSQLISIYVSQGGIILYRSLICIS